MLITKQAPARSLFPSIWYWFFGSSRKVFVWKLVTVYLKKTYHLTKTWTFAYLNFSLFLKSFFDYCRKKVRIGMIRRSEHWPPAKSSQLRRPHHHISSLLQITRDHDMDTKKTSFLAHSTHSSRLLPKQKTPFKTPCQFFDRHILL